MASEGTSRTSRPARSGDAGGGETPRGGRAILPGRVAGRRPTRGMCSLLLLCMCLSAVMTVPGCGGCRRDPNAAKKEEKKKAKIKPKPDFDVDRLRLQPFDDSVVALQGKWGHWSSAVQPMKANNFDFQGELLGATVGVNSDVPLELERTPFRLRCWRRASLPKGQKKYFETTYFVPRLPKEVGESVGLSTRLRGRSGGREVWQGKELPKPMPAHQYDIVVLSRQSDRYALLKRIDSVLAPWDDFETTPPGPYYRVLLPQITPKIPLPLPSQPLVWTTIAYVIWDDVDPDSLSLDQRQAMKDWLHWGGQLIISGPATLDTLRGSFLGDYLPAESGKSVQLTQAAFDPLNERFQLTRLSGGKDAYQPLEVVAGTWVEAIELKKHAEAEFMPACGELLVERRVGRGRIVITAFPLTDRRVVNWPSFDNFFNAYLLRRPPRQFSQTENLGLRVDWSAPHAGQRLDARLVTNLRYFSRDSGHLLHRERPAAAATDLRRGEADAPELTSPDVDGFDPSGVSEPATDELPVSETDPAVADTKPGGDGIRWDLQAEPDFDNGYRASPSRAWPVGTTSADLPARCGRSSSRPPGSASPRRGS